MACDQCENPNLKGVHTCDAWKLYGDADVRFVGGTLLLTKQEVERPDWNEIFAAKIENIAASFRDHVVDVIDEAGWTVGVARKG